jgi:hypothetical protein
VAKRRPKSKFSKLRAKANKAVAKGVRAVRKTSRKVTRKLERKLASNSLARAGRKATKKTTRLFRKSAKKIKGAKKSAKSLLRKAKRGLKDWKKRRDKAATQARKEQRARERDFNRLILDGTTSLDGAVIRQQKASSERGSSRPGEPPKMRTGTGRKSITAELRMKGNKAEARTYVDKRIAPYMAMWEFRQDGKQRPFLKPAVEDNLHLLGQEIGNTLKQQLKPQAGKKKAVVK